MILNKEGSGDAVASDLKANPSRSSGIIDEDLDKGQDNYPSSQKKGLAKGNVAHKKVSENFDIKQASELAKRKLSEALNKPANATISIENAGDYWLAAVEIIEEEYLPGQNLKSMNDLIGVYEVHLSHQGELLKWTRKNSYKRAEIK
jgi:hypothetical protein